MAGLILGGVVIRGAQSNVVLGWYAQLRLGFARAGSRTVLATRRHRGPLLVQRPFYPEANGTCHVYILHPPGGVVQGDVLEIEVDVQEGAKSLLTTPAAAKFYRAVSGCARQTATLRVARDACLEWLPQETIFFNHARANIRTRVDLERGGVFFGWEITCLGRPAAGEAFTQGEVHTHFEVWLDGVPVWIDRPGYLGSANSALFDAAWGLNRMPVFGTFVACSKQGKVCELVAALRPQAVSGNAMCAITSVDDLLICRAAGIEADSVRRLLVTVWQRVRCAIMNKPASIPRIWLT